MSSMVSFSASAMSVEDAIRRKRSRFPIIVTSSESLDTPLRPQGLNHMGESSLEHGVTYLLQNFVNIEFVHMRILQYSDQRAISQSHGGEFVADHDNFIGREFLIPRKYPGKLKVTNRPKKPTRYHTASQVLEDFPHYVKLEEETTSDKASGKNRVLSKGCTLELTKKTNKYIECVDRSVGQTTYKFHPNTHMPCSVVDDTRWYTLHTLVQIALPKVIKFEEIPVDRMSMILDDEKENIRCMTSGPLEVLGTITKEMIVAWTLNSGQVTCKLVLIPAGRWVKELVLLGNFRSEADKTAYMEENFKLPTKKVFLEKSFYMRPADDQLITELQEVDVDGTYSDREATDDYEIPSSSKPTTFQLDSPSEASGSDCIAMVYTSPTNTKPFTPVSHPGSDNLGKKITVNMAAQMAKKAEWFRQVHRDIVTKFQQMDKHTILTKTENKAVYGKTTAKPDVKQQKRPAVLPKPNVYGTPSNRQKTVSAYQDTEQKRNVKQAQSKDRSTYCQFETKHITPDEDTTREYEQIEIGAADCKTTPKADNGRDGNKRHKHKAKGSMRYRSEPEVQDGYIDLNEAGLGDETTQQSEGYVNNAVISSYVTPSSDHAHSDQQLQSYDYPNVREFMQQRSEVGTPRYSAISGIDMKSIERKNQTSEDFYNYSVNELRECFKVCKLDGFAEVCYENGLDGKFFNKFNFEQLKSDPFNLSAFDVIKVKKVIDGWRPNYEFQTVKNA